MVHKYKWAANANDNEHLCGCELCRMCAYKEKHHVRLHCPRKPPDSEFLEHTIEHSPLLRRGRALCYGLGGIGGAGTARERSWLAGAVVPSLDSTFHRNSCTDPSCNQTNKQNVNVNNVKLEHRQREQRCEQPNKERYRFPKGKSRRQVETTKSYEKSNLEPRTQWHLGTARCARRRDRPGGEAPGGRRPPSDTEHCTTLYRALTKSAATRVSEILALLQLAP